MFFLAGAFYKRSEKGLSLVAMPYLTLYRSKLEEKFTHLEEQCYSVRLKVMRRIHLTLNAPPTLLSVPTGLNLSTGRPEQLHGMCTS